MYKLGSTNPKLCLESLFDICSDEDESDIEQIEDTNNNTKSTKKTIRDMNLITPQKSKKTKLFVSSNDMPPHLCLKSQLSAKTLRFRPFTDVTNQHINSSVYCGTSVDIIPQMPLSCHSESTIQQIITEETDTEHCQVGYDVVLCTPNVKNKSIDNDMNALSEPTMSYTLKSPNNISTICSSDNEFLPPFPLSIHSTIQSTPMSSNKNISIFDPHYISPANQTPININSPPKIFSNNPLKLYHEPSADVCMPKRRNNYSYNLQSPVLKRSLCYTPGTNYSIDMNESISEPSSSSSQERKPHGKSRKFIKAEKEEEFHDISKAIFK